MWRKIVFDVIASIALFFLDCVEKLVIVVHKQFVPEQKADHPPPVDMGAPFVAFLCALLRKALEQGEIDVRIVQFFEQHLDGRWVGCDETMKWTRKATLLLSPNDLLWQ